MKKNKFIQGYACCLVNLIQSHGLTSPIEEAYRELTSYSESDMVKLGIDDFDIEIFKKNGLLTK